MPKKYSIHTRPPFSSIDFSLPDPADTLDTTTHTYERPPDPYHYQDLLHREHNNLYRDTGKKVGYFLLGYETWLKLGLELSNWDCLLRPTEFQGIPIIVDPSVEEKVVACPSLDNIVPLLGYYYSKEE